MLECRHALVVLSSCGCLECLVLVHVAGSAGGEDSPGVFSSFRGTPVLVEVISFIVAFVVARFTVLLQPPGKSVFGRGRCFFFRV